MDTISRQQNEPMYLFSLAPLFSLVALTPLCHSLHTLSPLSRQLLCLGFIAFVWQNCLLQIAGSSRLLPKEILAYSMGAHNLTENPCHGTKENCIYGYHFIS
jgi:hypothetical protein